MARASKKKHALPPRPAYLRRGDIYRYQPPVGSPHLQSPLRAVVGKLCMLLCDDGTFAAVTFGGGSQAWISADYLRVADPQNPQPSRVRHA